MATVSCRVRKYGSRARAIARRIGRGADDAASTLRVRNSPGGRLTFARHVTYNARAGVRMRRTILTRLINRQRLLSPVFVMQCRRSVYIITVICIKARYANALQNDNIFQNVRFSHVRTSCFEMIMFRSRLRRAA